MTSKEALKKLFFDNKDLHVDIVLNDRNVCEIYNTIKQDLERLKVLEEENQELKNKYEKLKTKYSNIRKYPPINQALMNYDEIDWEILKDEYGEEVLGNG